MQPFNRSVALSYMAMMNAVVIHDKYDKKVYDQTVELSEPLQDLLQTDPGIPDFETFLQDVFFSF